MAHSGAGTVTDYEKQRSARMLRQLAMAYAVSAGTYIEQATSAASPEVAHRQYEYAYRALENTLNLSQTAITIEAGIGRDGELQTTGPGSAEAAKRSTPKAGDGAVGKSE
jgi:hypothetical protein